MRVHLTAAWPTVTDLLKVTAEPGQTLYTVRAKTLSLRDRLTLRDAAGEAVAVLAAGWAGGYTLTIGETPAARIRGGRSPAVELLDGRGRFTVTGDVAGREYRVADRRTVLLTVSKALCSLTDHYALDVPEPADLLLAVGLAVAWHRLGAAG